MVDEGKKAPAFSLPNQHGKKVSLKDFAGKKLVLYFYPRDNTPGCTTEALGFRDAAKKLEKLNAVVLGVSKDSAASHCKFIEKQSLNFDLLTDADGEVLAKYGAWGEKVLYGKKSEGILRTTVVIDEQGVVKKVFPKVKVNGHVEKVLEVLAG
ncbi:MAG TPA: thioredoxin-dependent thiol peroxidase [Polyangiales bacterium]